MVWKMSLPPETVELVSHFLAAFTGLFYVLGGYYLGKWRSEKSMIDYFARAQFENMPDQGKLSPPSFEKMESGVKRSKWVGIACVAVGTALFVVRLNI